MEVNKKELFHDDLSLFFSSSFSPDAGRVVDSHYIITSRNYTAISGYDGPPVDEEFLEEISLVWLLADPPTPKAHLVMAYLYIVMMAIGFIGNAFVLFMFVK